MENKYKLNVLKISDKICLIQLVEAKICKIFNEFNIPPNTLLPIIKQKNKMLMFYCKNMKKMRMTLYWDVGKYLLKWLNQHRNKHIAYRFF